MNLRLQATIQMLEQEQRHCDDQASMLESNVADLNQDCQHAVFGVIVRERQLAQAIRERLAILRSHSLQGT